MKEVVNIQHQSEGNIHITRWDASSKKKKKSTKRGVWNWQCEQEKKVCEKPRAVRNMGEPDHSLLGFKRSS